MKRIRITILLSLTIGWAVAQTESTSSQYMLNPLSINPAYAGHFKALSGSVMYRFQSVGLEGAPVTQTFTVHSPLREEYAAVGLQVLRQTIAVSNQTSIFASYAYRLNISRFTVSAGLQVGLKISEERYTSLVAQNANDPVLDENNRTFLPNFGTGFFIHDERMYAGVSVPNIINFDKFNTLSTQRPIIVMGGYLFDINDNIKFKPSGLIRVVNDKIVEVNINASFVFKDVLMAGIAYRPHNAAIGLLQLFITDQLQLGYTYDAVINKLAPVTSGSHEIGIQYTFRYPRKDVFSPRYF